ncbi:hypothetical protein AB0H43_20335 [Hamadaea sp. NPDC050747]|uniref:hypothetical protein n=1 Tax=Hamadaea sp. NPDC050747 TaxID=3155789 RepID=UPI0033FCD98F
MLDRTPDTAPVIDLDNPRDRQRKQEHPQPWSRIRTSRVPIWTVVLLSVSSALAGAAAMDAWAARQQLRSQSTQVSLFVSVAGIGSATQDGEADHVRIEGTLAIMNGGPLPIEVTNVSDDATVVLHTSHRIAAEATTWFPAQVTIPCMDTAAPASMMVALSVLTADHHHRATKVQLQLAGTLWHDVIARGCRRSRE